MGILNITVIEVKKMKKIALISKRTIVGIIISTLILFSLSWNTTIIKSSINDYRTKNPSILALTPHAAIEIISDDNFTDYGFLGSGTETDPFIIEGYNITTTDGTGIFIRDTTKYFVIRNCYIDAEGHGIYIRFVTDGTVTIINNTCSNHDWAGIMLDTAFGSTVINNTCNNNEYGIYLIASGSSIVANNTCSNNDNVICLYASDSSTVTNNTFTNCGLEIREDNIDSYISNTVENNCVNSKKLGFYTNLDSTTIAEPVYGQLILVNCTNITVRDQILNNATIGLFLYSCTYSVIINNSCNNNGNYGISLYYSNSSNISNNTCNNNWTGIHLLGSSSSTVINNMCSNNNYGISLASSEGSTVSNNTCSNNNRYGICLSGSSDCEITYNLLRENEIYGVYLFPSSDNNLIHHNNFVDNNPGGTSQAYDDGTDNDWYDTETSEGNYWSDWSGTGAYAIDGFFTDVYDLYPLDEPAEYSTVETQIFFTFTLLIVVVPVILTKLFSRKRR